MQPSPAEVARTLALGRLVGTVQIAGRAGPYRVRHATDCSGQVLLLSRTDGELAQALVPAPGVDDRATVLAVADAPPVAGAPSLGQVWISGWVSELTGDAARAAALEYVEVNPASDLLDVGHGFVLHRMEVAEVRFIRGGTTLEVDLDEYVLAEPDPLHADEHDLLVDLADHHSAEVSAFVRRQLREGGYEAGSVDPRVVRMDRYGFVVDAGARYLRLGFPRPVRDRSDLAQMLHPMLCRRTQGSGPVR